LSTAIVPSYFVFAIMLLLISPLVIRLAGWRTPPDAEMRISDMDWRLLDWVRYAASNHVVRVLAGTLLRGSPLWTLHLRLAGAKVGRGVYVNTLSINDYNLLEFGDGVVIGAGVHLSGHTVEAGVVKTAAVRLSHNTTVGLSSIIEIGVETGPDCEIGALSFVPKRVKLNGKAVYVGIPVAQIH
jgi:acetyltransferase-like isoleucine patch superfamily enzyme